MYKIRPHHLLCLCFYEGYGYSESFTKNMDKVSKDIIGKDIQIVFGKDSLCLCCPFLKNGKCETEDKVTKYDNFVIQHLNLKNNQIVSYDKIHREIIDVLLETKKIKKSCFFDCQWKDICIKKLEKGVI